MRRCPIITVPAILHFVKKYAGVILIVGLAVALRLLFFRDLGRGIPYLTFYPAVMFAALYGGLFGGLLGTVLSALLTLFWIQHGTMSNVETMAMAMFCISCIMICFICEAMIRAKTNAKKAQAGAEAANRAKSVFLASMSHELRTPLNAILGFSTLMRSDTSLSDEHRSTLDIINRSGTHLLGLINDVLDVAKIEAGRTAVESAPLNLHGFAHDVVELMRQRAEVKGLSLSVDIDDAVPACIVSDGSRLRQILLNLVGNAVKFTSHGGVMVRLSGHAATPTQEFHLRIEVEDTGEGIAPADRERIFEPFVQLRQSADQKGTGLGLTITRQFIHLLGGTIRVESTLGSGSLFTVELPVKIAETAPMPVHEVPRVLRLCPGQPEQRVLVVDDQEENRLLLQSLLEKSGFSVRCANNGAEAVERFREWNPGFIWMDWRMPEVDGLAATRTIRSLENGGNVKIAVLSASVFKEERDAVLAAGADDFVAKPLMFDKIFECLARHLGVRLESSEPSSPDSEQDADGITAEAIAALPSDLCKGLRDALVSLDTAAISVAVTRISGVNPELGVALQEKTRRFHYSELLRIISGFQKTG